MKYNIITYYGAFVDVRLLDKGIYLTSIPVLYPIGTTIDSLINNLESVIGIDNELYNLDNYKNNLKQCTIGTVKLEAVN